MKFIPYASSSRGNFYQVVGDDGSRLLIECGIPIRDIKKHLAFDLSGIDGCLLSHSHMDHAKAAADITRLGIDLYCSRGTAEALSLDSHRAKHLASSMPVRIGAFSVLPFKVEHDAPDPLGFMIAHGWDRLIFATDTYFIHPRFAGLTHIAMECNWSRETMSPDLHPAVEKRLQKSHMELSTCKDFFRANDLSGVREIHLLHLSSDNGDGEFFKDEIQVLTGKPVYIAGR